MRGPFWPGLRLDTKGSSIKSKDVICDHELMEVDGDKEV